MTQAQAAQKAMNANNDARGLVLANSYPMIQQIASGNLVPANGVQLAIPPQNVGLIKGFFVELAFTFNVTAGSALALSPFGPANCLQNVLYTDLQNYQRINTTGWHIAFLNAAKQGRPFMSSTPSDSPIGFGSNWGVISAPSAPAGGSNGNTLRMFYWVPLAYGAHDLTGAVYGQIVNATQNLQLTFPTSAQFAVAAGDPLNAVYTGNTATVTNIQYTVYQSYLDQLPMNQGKPILPILDLSTIYELKNTVWTGIAANQDFNMGYSNFRHFMSTFAFYDNGSAWNAITPGSDVNFFSFRTANYTDTRKADPFLWKGLERQKISTDFPKGVYYFDTREKPIYTSQTGNVNLVMNSGTVNANAAVITAYEMFANVSNLQNAGSLGIA